ncbi:hypothetical protein DSO57_1002794 [Entomophthora muscae]|uniref:Uncharacterized protein n=1 Tax=Entomophthora muscae TaxID=34485 RepID=A0ACC2RNL5_9FUNG|nr:hypothetical protein DSO57_1002794 [Entomophthora muscae]
MISLLIIKRLGSLCDLKEYLGVYILFFTAWIRGFDTFEELSAFVLSDKRADFTGLVFLDCGRLSSPGSAVEDELNLFSESRDLSKDSECINSPKVTAECGIDHRRRWLNSGCQWLVGGVKDAGAGSSNSWIKSAGPGDNWVYGGGVCNLIVPDDLDMRDFSGRL